MKEINGHKNSIPDSCLRKAGVPLRRRQVIRDPVNVALGPGFRRDALNRDLKFKKISVLLHGLCTDDQITPDLFDTGHKENTRLLEKREALAGALDRLQQKYEKETVWLGTVPQTLSGHVGTKIAFSRVPDKEEFWD